MAAEYRGIFLSNLALRSCSSVAENVGRIYSIVESMDNRLPVSIGRTLLRTIRFRFKRQ